MPNLKNVEQLEQLSQQISASSGTVFLDYKGLSTSQLEKLRADIEQESASLNIAKNSLLTIAVKRTLPQQTSLPVDLFRQPTATLFLKGDYAPALKQLVNFIKVNELPVIKGGVVEHRLLDAVQVKTLAALPSREVLVSQLLGQLLAPVSHLVSGLSATNRNLVYALDAVRKSKGGE